MKKVMIVAILVLGLVLMSMPAAFALELGANITMYDGSSSTADVWYGMQEDQEVEPDCTTGQSWDLEGFFLNGNILTMVGGYDFANGYENTTSGDIFFDIDGDYSAGTAPSGDGYVDVSNSYGYDYAMHLDFSNDMYQLFSLDGNSQLTTVYWAQNKRSTPWRYASGGTLKKTLSFAYLTGANGLTDNDTGFAGVTHNAVAIDLGLTEIDFSKGFTAHFTMSCGNDNLMGQAAPVPEPQTLLLMGIGLLCLAFIGRKKLGERS